ncbi:MAG: dynamin family protein [Oscillospiraceae bacterium]|nr:dynamin family protein [Oscillospiraceae bacterium]
MYEISDSIEAIGGIIDELPVDADKVSDFRKQYQKISLRSRNPNFYLSAIGDFSSGKSTLINTLIGQKLLKVAFAATTAVPTYIYRGSGDQVAVRAKCDNGECYEITSDDGVRDFEEEFGVRLPEELDDRISLLTADKDLSPRIREVDIELPDGSLSGGLCIIDTPGVNPGADYTGAHAEITKNILNEVADAIIVLFPADQAYTQSFDEFLKANAEYFIKDAIFVVTMMDRVDEEERDEVIQFVKGNLRSNFHLENPQVLSCSAMMAGRDPFWKEDFAKFERDLMQRLADNRKRIVTERLAKLSDELLDSIQSEVATSKCSFEQRLTVLESHSVPKLDSLLADSVAEAAGKLTDIKSRHDDVFMNNKMYLESKIMYKVSTSLNSCTTRSDITKYVKGSMTLDIEEACRDVYNTSGKFTGELNETLNSAIVGMIEDLRTYYGEIGGILAEDTSLAASEERAAIADKFEGLDSLIGNYETKIDAAISVGGAGLAVLVFGPAGAIAGGLVALVAGDRLFVGSTRDKVKASVSERAPEISESVIQGLCDKMQSDYTEAMTELQVKKRAFLEQYQPVYEQLEKQLNDEKRELTRKIQLSEQIQNRITVVLSELNQIQGGIIDE